MRSEIRTRLDGIAANRATFAAGCHRTVTVDRADFVSLLDCWRSDVMALADTEARVAERIAHVKAALAKERAVTDAVLTCSACGLDVCTMCSLRVDGKRICDDCARPNVKS